MIFVVCMSSPVSLVVCIWPRCFARQAKPRQDAQLAYLLCLGGPNDYTTVLQPCASTAPVWMAGRGTHDDAMIERSQSTYVKYKTHEKNPRASGSIDDGTRKNAMEFTGGASILFARSAPVSIDQGKI